MPKLSLYLQIKLGKIRVHQRSPVEHRFWAKVNKGGPIPHHMSHLGPCWVWTGSPTGPGTGYGAIDIGMVVVGSRKRSITVKAHRYSWELHNGPIPNELQVCHKCDNSMCVNPSHLFLGTQSDNVQDCLHKGRHRHGDPRRDQRGELNGNARLTAKDIIDIRNRHIKNSKGHHSSKTIADDYGTTTFYILQIVNHQVWRSI